MTDPDVRWVVDHDDALHTRIAINDLHDLAAGVIVVHPQPATRRLAHDLLVALNKDFRSPGWPTSPPRAWKLAELWLTAEAVGHVVVYGAHRLTADDLQRLSNAAASSRATVWLLTCSPDQACRAQRSSLARLLTACGSARPLEVGETAPSSRPAVVCAATDFVTFRASCYRLLGLGNVRALDERLSEVMCRVQRWIGERRAHPNRWDAGALLEQLLGDARDQEDAVVVIRATQLAFFERGYLLSLDAATICDATRLILNQPANNAGAAPLRRMTDPALAALGALTACTPLDSQRLAGLRLHCVDDQGEHVTLGRVSYGLPVAMRGLLRAQLLHRAGQSATADEELFVDRAGGPCTPRRIRDLALKVRRHTLAGRAPRHVDDRSVWNLGLLLTVHRLRRAIPSHVPAAGLPTG